MDKKYKTRLHEPMYSIEVLTEADKFCQKHLPETDLDLYDALRSASQIVDEDPEEDVLDGTGAMFVRGWLFSNPRMLLAMTPEALTEDLVKIIRTRRTLKPSGMTELEAIQVSNPDLPPLDLTQVRPLTTEEAEFKTQFNQHMTNLGLL